jgi:hypothetical protein
VEEQAMMKSYGLAFAVFAIGIATVAHAHTLRLECKKITNQDVVCRAITSDGELARNIDIQLLATGDYRVLATGKTNAAVSMLSKCPMAGSISSRRATRLTSPTWQVWISGRALLRDQSSGAQVRQHVQRLHAVGAHVAERH